MAEQGKHGITWTDATWNPIRGCTRVSEGCRNCYAERVAARFSGPGQPYEGLARMTPSGPRWTGAVRVIEEHLNDPRRWRRPRRVFVNSMSDLFHERLAISDIERVFRVMLSAPRHCFQVLTKRAVRMAEVVPAIYHRIFGGAYPESVQVPPWIWLGVSVEDQETADERIPHLVQTPAGVRFLSAEPLLGPVDLTRYLGGGYVRVRGGVARPMNIPLKHLHWCITGGESGPEARPMHPDWARAIRDQCQSAGVAFHFKQWGAWAPSSALPVRGTYTGGGIFLRPDGVWGCQGDWWDGKAAAMDRVGKKAAGRVLDGRTWDEFPGEEASAA